MALLTEEEKEIDPYASLGLETSATDKDVKRAYRQKSLLYHPDKNPGAEAAAMFHTISLAVEMLLDRDKRKFVDTKLEQSRAASARRADMDAKRKAGVDDLMRREEEAKKARVDRTKARQAAAEEENVKEAGRRLVEEARKAREAAARAKAAPPPAPAARAQPPTIVPDELTLSLQLPADTILGTDSALGTALRDRYGRVSEVLVKPAKASKPGKKARGPAAVVEFAPGNWGGCWACWRDHSGDAGARPLEAGVKAKWPSGTEPGWVKWAEEHASPNGRAGASVPTPAAAPAAPTFSSAPSFGSTPVFGSTASFGSAPDFASGPAPVEAERDARERARKEEKTLADAFESATLLNMRMRERERLAEQIRREEAEAEAAG